MQPIGDQIFHSTIIFLILSIPISELNLLGRLWRGSLLCDRDAAESALPGAEIADDVQLGAKFPRLAALGWQSCTYQAGEVGTEMSVHGTKREFSPERLKGRKPPH